MFEKIFEIIFDIAEVIFAIIGFIVVLVSLAVYRDYRKQNKLDV